MRKKEENEREKEKEKDKEEEEAEEEIEKGEKTIHKKKNPNYSLFISSRA
jgi:hypothetical protein